MENAPVKPRLIDLLRRAHDDEQALLASLTPEERAATGTPERWSAKDIVAHIAFWKDRLIQHLAERARGESGPELQDSEVDQVNTGAFERNRTRSWEQVQADLESTFNRLLEMVSQFSEGQLTDPTPVGWYSNRPLLTAIVGNSYGHPEHHVMDFYLHRGDRASAVRIAEAATQEEMSVDTSPRSRGTALYNLACFYALNGDAGRAIELLRQAFPLRPDLVEWSKQDGDLTSLRELPEYQSLYR